MRPPRTIDAPVRPLSDFSIRDLLCFGTAWQPRSHAADRWQTWDHYLADWQAVRAEYLARFTGPAYADRVLALRERHGPAWLNAQCYETLSAILDADRA